MGGVNGNVVRFQLALVIGKTQIDQAMGIFQEALQEVAQPRSTTTILRLEDRDLRAAPNIVNKEIVCRASTRSHQIHDLTARLI